jgi:hypothetical protein
VFRRCALADRQNGDAAPRRTSHAVDELNLSNVLCCRRIPKKRRRSRSRLTPVLPMHCGRASTGAIQASGGLDLCQPQSERAATLLGTANHAQSDTAYRDSSGDHQTYRVAHLPPYVFDLAAGRQSRHLGHAGTASARLQPGHHGYVHTGRYGTKTRSSEWRSSVVSRSRNDAGN